MVKSCKEEGQRVLVDDYPSLSAVLVQRGPEQSEVKLSDGRRMFVPNSHLKFPSSEEAWMIGDGKEKVSEEGDESKLVDGKSKRERDAEAEEAEAPEVEGDQPEEDVEMLSVSNIVKDLSGPKLVKIRNELAKAIGKPPVKKFADVPKAQEAVKKLLKEVPNGAKIVLGLTSTTKKPKEGGQVSRKTSTKAKVVKSDTRKRVARKYDDDQVITITTEETNPNSPNKGAGGVYYGWEALRKLKNKTVGNFVSSLSDTKLATRSRGLITYWEGLGYIKVK